LPHGPLDLDGLLRHNASTHPVSSRTPGGQGTANLRPGSPDERPPGEQTVDRAVALTGLRRDQAPVAGMETPGTSACGAFPVSHPFSRSAPLFRITYPLGTTNRVRSVEQSSPPTTAIASGCISSEPSPIPSASGDIPITVVSVVMRIGRMRTTPAS